MRHINTFWILAVFSATVVLALPWADRSQPESQALHLRPAGDLELFHHETSVTLEKRVELIPFIGVMPAMVLGSASLGWCYRSDFDTICIALMATAVALALAYAAVWWYRLIKYERNTRVRQDEKERNDAVENVMRAAVLPHVLAAEKSDREDAEWKRNAEREKRLWVTPLKYALEGFRQLLGGHPLLKEKYDEAEKSLKLAESAWEQYIAADPSNIAVSLDSFRETEKGVLSQDLVYELKKEAREAEKAVRAEFLKIITADKEALDAKVKELPFFPVQHDSDFPLGDKLSRRSLFDPMPRLLKETTENCDTQLCHRLWYSNSLLPGRKRAEISSSDIIYNLYSTPVDFDFETNAEHRAILKRDQNTQFNCEEPINEDGHRANFAISVVAGDDFESLEKIFNSLVQNVGSTEKLFENTLKKGNISDFNQERWQCINADSDNGGAPALRGVAIFTTDAQLLHAATAPILNNCLSIL